MSSFASLRGSVLNEMKTSCGFPNELLSLIESYVEYHPLRYFLSSWKHPYLEFVVLSGTNWRQVKNGPRVKYASHIHRARKRSWANVLSSRKEFNAIYNGEYRTDDGKITKCYMVSYRHTYRFSSAIYEEPTQEQLRKLFEKGLYQYTIQDASLFVL